jgi:hypothetical protein
MFADYQAEILRTYHKKKAENVIPLELIYPTPANIRDACERAVNIRFLKKDVNTIRSFFGDYANATAYVKAIRKFDIDLFRPLNNFLKGGIKNTDEKNIELLAWLIDFEPRPYQADTDLFNVTDHGISLPLKENSKEKNEVAGGNYQSTLESGKVQQVRTKERSLAGGWKAFILMALVALLGYGSYLFWGHSDKEGCMVWVGDRYKQVSCNQKQGDAMVMALDTSKLVHFKKITRQDTITARAVGRVWYSKIDNNVEFFTADGYHPVHVERHLKPLSLYMLNKYIIHK